MYIEVVSFDADRTIVSKGYVNRYWFGELPRLYGAKKGIDLEEAREQLTGYYNEIGDEDIRWYEPRYWFDRFDLDRDPADVIEKIQTPENLELYQDAIDSIDELEGNFKLIVTSNAPRIFLDYALKDIESRFFGIYSCVSDFGEVKKHQGVYRRVLDLVETAPENVVHVGDHWKFDYLVPRQLGIQTFFIDRDGKRRGEGDGVVTDLRDMVGRIRNTGV